MCASVCSLRESGSFLKRYFRVSRDDLKTYYGFRDELAGDVEHNFVLVCIEEAQPQSLSDGFSNVQGVTPYMERPAGRVKLVGLPVGLVADVEARHDRDHRRA